MNDKIIKFKKSYYSKKDGEIRIEKDKAYELLDNNQFYEFYDEQNERQFIIKTENHCGYEIIDVNI